MLTIDTIMIDKRGATGRPRNADESGSARTAEFLLRNLPQHPQDIVSLAVEKLGISRQAVHVVLQRLIREGWVSATGKTRARRYSPGPKRYLDVPLKVDRRLDEHQVWDERIAPFLADLPQNVLSIYEYGFTEMLNNVIDHSGADKADVIMERDPRHVLVGVVDHGVGIFEKIKREYGLATENQAIFELTKGKLTTDPEHHTGEGIFFTSKMFDYFAILSGRLFVARTRSDESWSLEGRDPHRGTAIWMELDPASTRTTTEVFDRYATSDHEYAFDRTHLVVNLINPEGSSLLSRSQAKRVLARLERFREVVLDFEGVVRIGPAFADEIFRVFANSHPEVQLQVLHANEEVQAMITKAMRAREEQQRTS